MGESISQSDAALVSGMALDNSTDGLDWDDLEEVAPRMKEEESNNDEEIESNDESDDVEDEDSDSGDDSTEDEKSSKQADSETEDTKSEDSSGEDESDKESSKEAELIELKVNGKTEKVSLDDLKQNYSGKVAYDKKFTEMDKERQSFQKEIASVNEYVEELGETMRNVSVLEGLYKIGELNNIGAHSIKQALIKEIMPEINRLADMDESQADLEYQKADLDYKRDLQSKEAANFQEQQSQAELSQNISKVKDSLNIDDNEWSEAFDYLDTNLDKGEQITPDLMAEYVQFNRAESRTESALNLYNDGEYLANEETFGQLHNVIMDNPDFTDEDIQGILNDAFGKAEQEAIEEKVEKISKKRSPKQKASSKQSKQEFSSISGENDDLDWDDIL